MGDRIYLIWEDALVPDLKPSDILNVESELDTFRYDFRNRLLFSARAGFSASSVSHRRKPDPFYAAPPRETWRESLTWIWSCARWTWHNAIGRPELEELPRMPFTFTMTTGIV